MLLPSQFYSFSNHSNQSRFDRLHLFRSPTPSFVLLDIRETTVVTHAYFLERGKVEVERTVYRKPSVAEKKSDAKEKGTYVEIDPDANSFGAQGGTMVTIPQPPIIRESSSPSTKNSSKGEERFLDYQWQPRGPFKRQVTRSSTLHPSLDRESPSSNEAEKDSSKGEEGYFGYHIRGPNAHWIKSGVIQRITGSERGRIPVWFEGGSSGYASPSDSTPSASSNLDGGRRMRGPRR
jgi:hypothetical protein